MPGTGPDAGHGVGIVDRLRDPLFPATKKALFRAGLVPPPFRIQMDITDRCNFRCPMCSKSGVANHRPELTLEAWKRIMAKVRHVPLFREISITGGEPFIRSDILGILDAARLNRLKTVIVTNGWYVDRKVMAELKILGVACLIVSLNSMDRNTHDQSRRMSGSFDRVMQLIDNWRQCGKPVGLCLSTVVMEGNRHELLKIAEFAGEQGAGGVWFQALSHNGAHYAFAGSETMPHEQAGWQRDNPFWIRKPRDLKKRMRDLVAYKRQHGVILNPSYQLAMFVPYYRDPVSITDRFCLGPYSRLYIDPYGDMRLCYGYPPVGNILHDAPLKAWNSRRAKKIRNDAKKCRRSCRLLNNNL